MKFFWTWNEGKVFAIDKLGHFILYFVLVSVLITVFKIYPVYAWFISVIAGFLYEWIGDCIIMNHGASKLDLLANTVGGIAGVVVCDLLFTL